MKFERYDLYTVSRDGEYYVLQYHDNGSIFYWLNGVCQREGGPSTIFLDGTKWWSWNGCNSTTARTWNEFIIQMIIE